jgi:hypothetical protein
VRLLSLSLSLPPTFAFAFALRRRAFFPLRFHANANANANVNVNARIHTKHFRTLTPVSKKQSWICTFFSMRITPPLPSSRF